MNNEKHHHGVTMWWGNSNKQAALLKERQEKLTAAIEEGRTAHVWLILEQDKDLVNYKIHTTDKQKEKKKKDEADIEYRGETALHIATNYNDIVTAALLIQLGATVNAENDMGETALHLASKQLNVDMVNLLLAKGASVNAKSNLGWTALHYVSFYANVKREKTKTGNKAAAKKQNTSSDIALVHALLDNGAHVNSQTNTGWTPLHWAALKGNQGIVFALMDRGGDSSITNNKGKTPCQMANLGMKPEQLRAYQQSLETASTAAVTTTAASTENSSAKEKNEKDDQLQEQDVRRVAVEKLRDLQDAASYLSEQQNSEMNSEMATILTEVNALHERLLRFQHFSELLHHDDRPTMTRSAQATTRTTRSAPATNEKVPTEVTIISTTSSTSDMSSLEPNDNKPVLATKTPSSRFGYF